MLPVDWLRRIVLFSGRVATPMIVFLWCLYDITVNKNWTETGVLESATMVVLAAYFIEAWVPKRTKEEG